MSDPDETPANPDFIERLRRYATLQQRRKELEDRAASVNEEIAAMKSGLLDEFLAAGLSRLSFDDVTVYRHRTLWAGVRDGRKVEAMQALQRNGLDHFVHQTFNVQTLSAHVRELERNDEELPKEVLEHIKVSEVVDLRVIRA